MQEMKNLNKPQRILNTIEEHGTDEGDFISISELDLLEKIDEDDFYQYLDQDLTKVKNILPKPVMRKNGKVFVNKNFLSDDKNSLIMMLETNNIERLLRNEYKAKSAMYLMISLAVIIVSILITYIYTLNFVEISIILDPELLN
jgi:hypothetical protein